jgi:hypothetical protein
MGFYDLEKKTNNAYCPSFSLTSFSASGAILQVNKGQSSQFLEL